MSHHEQPRYQYGTVRRRMERVSKDRDYHLRRSRIDRVLELLDGDNLVALAATKPNADEGMIFECSFASEIWDDPLIERKVQQLASNDITVELIDHEHTIAGKTFKRTQLRVNFLPA